MNMIIEFLNYQPFYYLIGIRMLHIISFVIIYYLISKIIKDKKELIK